MNAKSEPPKVGEYVLRIDDQRIGVVECIARAGELYDMPMFEGDVCVRLSPWRAIVTSGWGFWTKWRRVDTDAMAAVALEEGL